MIRVQVFHPDGHPMMRSFGKNEVLIGRKPSNDIILAGQDVSGTHACLQVENGRVTLVDLGSTNGTFVNSERIQVSAQLSPADEIKISVFTLHVSFGDDRSVGAGDGPASPALAGASGPTRPMPIVGLDAPSGQRSITPAPRPTPVQDPPPPPVHRGTPPASDDLPPSTRRNGTPADDHPPPVRRSSTPAPSDDLPPPIRRGPMDDTLGPARPAHPSGPSAPGDGDGPPVVARARTAPGPRVPLEPAAATEASDLEQAWADPTVRRIIITGLQRVEVERDGVCLPLARGFASVNELGDRLAALCGRPVLRESPTECVLADGTAVQAILDGDRGPHVVITRARSKRSSGLDALVQERALPALAAELLLGCLRARLPVLLIAGPGVLALPLLGALLGALEGSTGLVRGLPAPAVAPRGCVAIDASYGSGHMAAAVRLVLATEVAWLAVDEPEPAALEECAWASVGGRGVLVGVRASSLEHALARAHAAAAPTTGPGIGYVLAVMLAAPSSASAGSFVVTRLVELRRDDQGPGSVQEIFGVGRRGELIPIAVPAVLAELTQRGVHIAPELFTPV